MAYSRLSRRSSKQGKKQLYFSIVGIVVIIFAALNFGPLAIAALGNTIDTITGKNAETNAITSDAQLKPPVLDPLPQAVSTEEIDVAGRAYYTEGRVELFLNDLRYDSMTLDNTQDFQIENISLKNGSNSIKVKFVQDERESDFSEELIITYLKDDPKLELVNPQDGQSFEKADLEINVRGTTDPENSVKVNDFIAIVDADGEFSYLLRLSDGENKIKVVATDQAGNTAEKEITVSYSP